MDRLSPTAQALDGIRRRNRPTAVQLAWLRRGLDQAGGKLPLFDRYGQRYDGRTIRSCVEQGWAEPWFKNPIKPDWLVCKLTAAGRRAAQADEVEGDGARGGLEAQGTSEGRDARIRNLVDDLFA